MSDTPSAPPAWHPDPHARHQLRYWDGARWTEHVSDNGVTSTDPVGGTESGSRLQRFERAVTVGNEADPANVRAQVSGDGRRGAGITERVEGGGTLFTEPILVVNQKAKVIELTNQYAVLDQDGNQLAFVNQIGQSTLKKAVRLVSSLDQFMTHTLQITDVSGTPVLHVTRPRKFVKSSFDISDGAEQPIGRVVQRNVFGKIRFSLEAGGAEVGTIQAENWRAWNFRIEDHTGTEVARITKTWEGLARTLFTTADNYVVQIHTPLAEPLRSLTIASALTVDTALKQDSRGFN